MEPSSCHGGWGNPGTGEPLTIDEATTRAQEYIDSLGNPDLVLAEVMEFENNFYAEVREDSTGIHAFELLSVNGYTGAVWYHTWHGDFIGMQSFDHE
ncbi:MAG: hypothetical protein D6791_14580 [Chloroflexi bacterium]|nr:MAG: hypothetical protein D6791_14580 [Chloroflexota bacterium]